MKHLFPYIEERINSNKNPEDIFMILKSVTDSREVVLSTSAEFIGQVHPLDFKIAPNLNYRNSFLPIAAGKMTEKDGGTTIEITLQMHILTRIFLLIWFGMACFFFLCGILVVLTGGVEKITLILISLGFIVCGQVLMRCSFYSPARKVLKRLKELLCQAQYPAGTR